MMFQTKRSSELAENLSKLSKKSLIPKYDGVGRLCGGPHINGSCADRPLSLTRCGRMVRPCVLRSSLRTNGPLKIPLCADRPLSLTRSARMVRPCVLRSSFRTNSPLKNPSCADRPLSLTRCCRRRLPCVEWDFLRTRWFCDGAIASAAIVIWR